MFNTLVVFVVSVVVLAILILHKAWEIKKGKAIIPKRVLDKTDSIIQGQIEMHKEVIVGGGKKGVRMLSSITRESIKHLFLVVVHYLHDKLTQIIIKAKGKGIRNKKSVSFFLKRMEEYKEEKSKRPVDIVDKTQDKQEASSNNLGEDKKVSDF